MKKIKRRDLVIRSRNRCELHPQGKKQCTGCETVYDNIPENFDIHKRKENGEYLYAGRCKSCQATYRAELSIRRKQNGLWYFQKLIGSLKHRAAKEGVKFNLTADELNKKWHQQEAKCYYTNNPMDLLAFNEDRKSPHYDFPSLDRKIPSSGYTKENVVWCTWVVNRMKNNLTDKQFVQFCKKVITIHD